MSSRASQPCKELGNHVPGLKYSRGEGREGRKGEGKSRERKGGWRGKARRSTKNREVRKEGREEKEEELEKMMKKRVKTERGPRRGKEVI